MEEIETSGIVVGAEDYKEADKLLRILTPDYGVVRAVIRGVKKEKAKLKFAAMPFSFCEYHFIRRGAYYSVKTAQPAESLFGVTSSPESYVAAAVMLETAAEAASDNDASTFISLLMSLKELIYSQSEPYGVCLAFVLSLLEKGGHATSSEQELINAEVSRKRLKATLRNFETKFICKIKSAALL